MMVKYVRHGQDLIVERRCKGYVKEMLETRTTFLHEGRRARFAYNNHSPLVPLGGSPFSHILLFLLSRIPMLAYRGFASLFLKERRRPVSR
jgi:hypothetical protein